MNSSKRNSLLPVIGVLCQMGLMLAFTTHYPKLKHLWTPSSSPQSETFRLAVNEAMNAAKLTQSAKSREEWKRVASSWQEAIDLMDAVPLSHSNYSVAQKKISEYQRNLQYALSHVSNKTPISPVSLVSRDLWTFGSTREEVISIQGTPTGVVQDEQFCQEILYYENSTVKLKNGIVTEYDNLDKNLRVSVTTPATQQQGTNRVWSLGSTKEDVFKVQGTPARVTRSDPSGEEVLYYGSSAVALKNGLVIGYNNLGNNLRISVNRVAATQSQNTEAYWTIGSNRNNVFQIQGTPTQVVQYESLCKEIVYYGSSTVEFKKGTVEGYYNLSNNLKVKSNSSLAPGSPIP